MFWSEAGDEKAGTARSKEKMDTGTGEGIERAREKKKRTEKTGNECKCSLVACLKTKDRWATAVM